MAEGCVLEAGPMGHEPLRPQGLRVEWQGQAAPSSFFFCCPRSIWKFLDQGSNLSWSFHLSHSCSPAGPRAYCTTEGTPLSSNNSNHFLSTHSVSRHCVLIISTSKFL